MGLPGVDWSGAATSLSSDSTVGAVWLATFDDTVAGSGAGTTTLATTSGDLPGLAPEAPGRHGAKQGLAQGSVTRWPVLPEVDWSNALGYPAPSTAAVDPRRPPGLSRLRMPPVDWSHAAGLRADVTASEPRDLVFPHPRTGRSVSFRALLGQLRANGVEAHPFGADGDAAFVDALARRSRLGADHVPHPPEESEDAGIRSRWFGVDRARVPWPVPRDRTDLDESNGDAYGYMDEMFEDLAALRGGCFREGLSSDLTWHHVFPDTEIPKPDVIREWLRADRYLVLAHFLVSTLLARVDGIKLFPTVFVRGGGEGLNPDTHSPGALVSNPVTHAHVADAPNYDTVRAGRTRHHASALIPSPLGWDPWYYDSATLGIEAPLSMWTTSSTLLADGTVVLGEGDDGTFVETNQRFALNVYNGDRDDPTVPAGADTYLGLVAIRKSLAVAAFGQGVGEFLRRVDGALRADGLELIDTIPHLELGAENDAQWAFTDEVLPDADSLSLSEAFVLWSQPTFKESAREYARFHAVLASTIRTEWPSARFKASESASWGSLREAAARPAWLGYALGTELAVETEFIRAASWADTSARGVQDWLDQQAAGEANCTLPVLSVSTADLIHVVGFHWFHYWVYGSAADPGYQSEADMYANTLVPFFSFVLQSCALAGFHVGWGVGNFGFPSAGSAADAWAPHDPAYPANSQELEAGHLVRGFLTLVAYGASHVLWFSHMGEKEGQAAGLFATMGLRNDVPIVQIDADADGELDPLPAASMDAWPKAAWYAFQRLSTFMSRCAAANVVYNTGGVVVIQLTAGADGFVQPDASGRRWRYAYVFWIDGASTTTTRGTATVTFELRGGNAFRWPFERVALVPGATNWAEDETPYAESTAPDWADSDAGANPDFGHASQMWQFRNPPPPNWSPAPGPDGTIPTPPPYLEVSVNITATTPDNFGIVAWLLDTADLRVA